ATIAMRGAAGITVRLGAVIAVESPRNFRLIVNGPMSSREADLGSNDERFWFWNKRNEEKCVFTAKHEQETGRARQFPIPFQPDWIMESLGVIEIEADQATVQPDLAGPQSIALMSDRISPQGLKVRKITIIDTCRGVIREHALYDARGALIARAALSGHFRDMNSDAVLPKQIELEWPQAHLGLTMTLSDIEVNRHIPAQTWVMPDIEGYAVYDLSQ
ncbi:MAG TPA: hypothetical protein VKU82_03205, partial [Planctomycetaceae bacterium]|nr:hypothetical protein [Planctomycetaceae bacterium]